MDEDQLLRDRAYRIAEEKAGFYIHLAAFLLVNVGLWALWFFTSRDSFPWPIFITGFWGFGHGKLSLEVKIGQLMHGVGAFLGDGYTESLAEKEYEKLKRKRGL